MHRQDAGKDRRIEKTHGLLHAALSELIREKPYDSIAVKEILERANVGRSTFYMHFRDKDELLASSIHQMVRSVHESRLAASKGTCEAVLRFSLPIFEHIEQHKHTGAAKMGVRGRAVIHERLRQVLAEQIEDEVKKETEGRRKATGDIPPDLLAQQVASTFVLVLNWWVETGSRLRPKEIDDLFRALIEPVLIQM